MIPMMLDPKSMLKDVLKLSPKERLELVEAIWQSLEEIPDEFLLTEDQRAELRARYEDYRRNPNAGATWEEVEKRILDRL